MAGVDAVTDGLTGTSSRSGPRGRRRPGRRARRTAVVGSAALRLAVHEARPATVALVAAASPDDAEGVLLTSWDQVVVDDEGLAAVRAWPAHLLDGREVLAVPDTDPACVAAWLAPPFGRWAPFKRLLDVVVAATLLVLLSPLLVVAGIAVRLDSPGESVFRQQRIGRGGQPFRFYKLRSMRTDGDDSAHRAYCAALVEGSAERHGGLFKLADDPRVTPVGRVLRRTSLDELPQLWNVLRGQMSLVGPRPLLPSDAELFTAEHWGRLRVRPGITGPWQVAGRSELSFQEMVRLDVDYSLDWTPARDLRVLLATPRAALGNRRTA